jgi:hypothetical protein
VVVTPKSSGYNPPDFNESNGAAIAQLIAARKSQQDPIVLNIIDGDAPAPVGDGSCHYHAFASFHKNAAPLLGIRLRFENESWHLAGYWTP